MSSHQEREYQQLQGARPCCYRGEHELTIKHEPESACCKAKDLVIHAQFFCKLYNKYIVDTTKCWVCTERKEQLPPEPGA